MVDTSLHRASLIQPLRSICLWMLATVLIAIAPYAPAQSQDITLDTPATSDQIQNWLYSGDPRLIAWGAHFAQARHDEPAFGYMVQLLARQTLGPANLATIVMLDALIEHGTTVPVNTVAIVAPAFPAQAAILAARLPLADSTPLLLDWYSHRASKDYSPLPRVAAMMLSHAPPPGFAASVLSESVETLRLSVVSNLGPGFGIGTGGSCVGGGARPPRSGWPPVFTYFLVDVPLQTSQPLLVEAAGDQIAYIRRDFYKPAPCGGPTRLNASNRHHLLAQMLNLTDQAMPWKADKSASSVWHDEAQYLREATATVAAEEPSCARLSISSKPKVCSPRTNLLPCAQNSRWSSQTSTNLLIHPYLNSPSPIQEPYSATNKQPHTAI